MKKVVEKTGVVWAVAVGLVLFMAVWILFCLSLKGDMESVCANRDTVSVSAGVGRVTDMVELPVCSSNEENNSGTIFKVWCETDDNLPDWFDPESAEIVWIASEAASETVGVSNSVFPEVTPNAAPVRDTGCPDWNMNTSIYGWDGHTMEVWELDLFSRVFYKEFWGTSEMCCEAGCDAMLRLWDCGVYGSTMGESLSAVNESGDWVYSTYPYVWETEYDAEGLNWCKEFCLQRFQTGPSWTAMFFRTKYYHDLKWSIPCYSIDNVYFSVSKYIQ